MIKVFKDADIKGKIATIISWSMMVLAIINIFTRNDLIRLTVWVGVVIAISLDFLLMLQLYQKAEKKLFEERMRRINFAYELRALRYRIEIDGLNKVQTCEELDDLIEKYLGERE